MGRGKIHTRPRADFGYAPYGDVYVSGGSTGPELSAEVWDSPANGLCSEQQPSTLVKARVGAEMRVQVSVLAVPIRDADGVRGRVLVGRS